MKKLSEDSTKCWTVKFTFMTLVVKIQKLELSVKTNDWFWNISEKKWLSFQMWLRFTLGKCTFTFFSLWHVLHFFFSKLSFLRITKENKEKEYGV